MSASVFVSATSVEFRFHLYLFVLKYLCILGFRNSSLTRSNFCEVYGSGQVLMSPEVERAPNSRMAVITEACSKRTDVEVCLSPSLPLPLVVSKLLVAFRMVSPGLQTPSHEYTYHANLRADVVLRLKLALKRLTPYRSDRNSDVFTMF